MHGTPCSKPRVLQGKCSRSLSLAFGLLQLQRVLQRLQTGEVQTGEFQTGEFQRGEFGNSTVALATSVCTHLCVLQVAPKRLAEQKMGQNQTQRSTAVVTSMPPQAAAASALLPGAAAAPTAPPGAPQSALPGRPASGGQGLSRPATGVQCGGGHRVSGVLRPCMRLPAERTTLPTGARDQGCRPPGQGRPRIS